MALTCHAFRQAAAAQQVAQQRCQAACAAPMRPCRPSGRAQRLLVVAMTATGQQSTGTKTIIQKTSPNDMPFPWTEKDPYKLPVSIDRVQKLLISQGWERAWIEQIVDRMMKGMLKSTEERTQAVIDYLVSVGLTTDQICNMASISVVLLGLNPETRLKPVVEYIKARGVPADEVPKLVLSHPRIFEYKVTEGGRDLVKGKAHIQVDVIPMPTGQKAVGVNYFRDGASFLQSPVTPAPPMQG